MLMNQCCSMMNASKRVVIGIVVIIFCFVGIAIYIQNSYEGKVVLSTWLWITEKIKTSEERNRIIEKALEHQMNQVYLQIDDNIDIYDYQAFVSTCKEKGINVFALSGSPEFIYMKQDERFDRFFSFVENYQNVSADHEKFSGIHFDVEPYLLSTWDTEQSTIIRQFQDMLLHAKDKSTEMNLSFMVDIPFWFDEIHYNNEFGRGNLAEWIIEHLDQVTIMAYRDNAADIKKIVRNELLYARKNQKSIEIAVELKKVEPEYVTFYEEGLGFLHNQILAVKKAYRSDNITFAIHDLNELLDY